MVGNGLVVVWKWEKGEKGEKGEKEGKEGGGKEKLRIREKKESSVDMEGKKKNKK